MTWVSRLTGILLLGVGVYSLAGLAIFGVSGDPILAGISIAMNFGMGVAALYIPHLFSNFSRSWEGRLTKGEEAEKELRRVLEGEA
jgi:hypothetical protein